MSDLFNNFEQKFKGKYRINSNRLTEYDYSQNGGYFLTICAKDRQCLFGEIGNEKMIANQIGKIVMDCWQGIPNHFPDVVLDAHVLMPNHLHGVIFIDNPNVETKNFSSLQTW
jgi:putative transposase